MDYCLCEEHLILADLITLCTHCYQCLLMQYRNTVKKNSCDVTGLLCCKQSYERSLAGSFGTGTILIKHLA